MNGKSVGQSNEPEPSGDRRLRFAQAEGSGARLESRPNSGAFDAPANPSEGGLGPRTPRHGLTDCGGGRENGMVTVEAAIGLLVIGFVLTLLAMLTNVAIMYVGAQEAARSAARMASLDKSVSSIQAVVEEKSPGAQVSVARRGETVEVTVRVPPNGCSGALGISVTATTVAFVEPGAGQ